LIFGIKINKLQDSKREMGKKGKKKNHPRKQLLLLKKLSLFKRRKRAKKMIRKKSREKHLRRNHLPPQLRKNQKLALMRMMTMKSKRILMITHRISYQVRSSSHPMKTMECEYSMRLSTNKTQRVRCRLNIV